MDGAGGDDTITVNNAAAHDLTGGSGDDTFIFPSRLHLDAANTIAGGTGYDTIDVTQSADLDYAAALSNISGIDQLLISGIGDKILTVGNDVVAQSDLGTSIGVGSTGTFTLSAALTGGNRANITTEALVTLAADVANWVSIDDDVGGNADGVGGLVRLGTAGDNITGGAEDDVVTLGTAGGVDTVSLGGGDDTINTTVENLEDTDVITGGAGDDTLSTNRRCDPTGSLDQDPERHRHDSHRGRPGPCGYRCHSCPVRRRIHYRYGRRRTTTARLLPSPR